MVEKCCGSDAAWTPYQSGWYPDPYKRVIYNVTRLARPTVCVEIGLGDGFSTEAILTALHANGEPAVLYSVELRPWAKGIRVGQRLSRSPVRWHLVYGRSWAVRDAVPSEYDFLYIDGGHALSEITLDFATYEGGLIAGGVLLIDDLQLRGPTALVARLAREPSRIKSGTGWTFSRHEVAAPGEESDPNHIIAVARKPMPEGTL